MEATQTVLLDALLIILLTLYSWGEGGNYEPKSELTKETWTKIQQLGDITSDADAVLKKYEGATAESCVKQLPQQNYRSGLDVKLASYKSKLDYDDKLLQSDLLKCESDESCKEEVRTEYQHNMDAIVTNANRFITRLKATAIKNLGDFMDSCTQGNVVSKDEDKQVAKRTIDEDQEQYSEPGNQWHW